jgi:1,4-dihydroxy-2-naphthoyl-CoA hydrolase
MVFITHNKVRMHDTDMAGVLYFARQFRFVHDALEDFVESQGVTFDQVFHAENFVFLIVHCEADYFTQLRVGDLLEVHVHVERIGTTSFTMLYHIYKTDKTLAGTAKTVHVCVDKQSRTKINIPNKLNSILEQHLI